MKNFIFAVVWILVSILNVSAQIIGGGGVTSNQVVNIITNGKSPNAIFSGVNPYVLLKNTTNAANNRVAGWQMVGEDFRFRAFSDDLGSFTTWAKFYNRTNNNYGNFQLAGGLFDFNLFTGVLEANDFKIGGVSVTNLASGVTTAQLLSSSNTVYSAGVNGTNTLATNGRSELNSASNAVYQASVQRNGGVLTNGQFFGNATLNGITLSNALMSEIPVTLYGATGDGATDDTSAIQAALNTGRIVWLPKRSTKYRITSALTIPAGGGLRGDGKYASVIDFQSADGDSSVTIDATAGGATIRDIGTTSTTKTSVTNINSWTGFARSIRAGNNTVIENVSVENASHGIVISSSSSPSTNVFVLNISANNIRNSDGSGAAIYSGRGFNLKVSGISVTNCDRGIEIENGSKNAWLSDGYLKSIYPTGYVGIPSFYLTNYTFVLDAHTHTGEGIVENIHYNKFTLESVGVACLTANAQDMTDIARNISFRNISVSNLVDINFTTANASALTGINNAENVVLENVTVEPQIMTNKTFMITLVTTKNVEINDCKFLASAPTYIQLASDSVRSVIKDCLFRSTMIRVTNRSRNSNIATLNTAGAHGLVPGMVIGVANINGSGSGWSTLTATVATTATADTFTYVNTGTDASSAAESQGFIYIGGGTTVSDSGQFTTIDNLKFASFVNAGTYLIRQEALGAFSTYVNNSADLNPQFYTASRARSANVATITFTKSHNWKVGDYVVVENVGGSSYNTSGSVPITAIPSTTSFSYANTAGNEGTTADTAGDVYQILGYASTGAASGLIRITGQNSVVSNNRISNQKNNSSSPFCNIDSTVTGGALSVVLGNVGYYTRTDATPFTSGSTVSNYTLVNNTANLASLGWVVQGLRVLSYGNVSGGANIGTVGFFDNVTNLNLFGASTNAGTWRQTGVATFLSTASVPTNTANASIVTTDIALNTYYTNSAQRAWVAETFSLTSALTGSSVVALYLDQNADGTFESTGMQVSQGTIVAEQANLQLSGFLQPGARYMFTNILGSGASASVVTGSGQLVKE